MLTWEGVHPATLCSVLLEMKCLTADDKLVTSQTATGFIYKMKHLTFLITNWHVVTGRNPDNPLHILTDAHDSPVRVEFCLPLKSNKNHFLPGGLDLYEKGQPVWFEAKPINGRIDIVAIPIEFPENSYVVTVQDFAESGGRMTIGDDLVIVGYPFGRYENNPHSIWKKEY